MGAGRENKALEMGVESRNWVTVKDTGAMLRCYDWDVLGIVWGEISSLATKIL